MPSRTFTILLMTFGALLLCGVETARACRCAVGKFEPCQAYGSASAVFVGTVTGVGKTTVKLGEGKNEEEYGQRLFTFQVDESFSGVSEAQAQIVTGQGGGDCGFGFRSGATYLVYAHRDTRDGRLHTGICSPTKPIEKADDDLKFLRTLASREPGATLSGSVVTSYPTKENEEPSADKRAAGLPIIVEGEGERRELQTDARGRYQLTGLKAGTYTVKVVLPDELHSHSTEQKVTIAERGCGGANFFISDNGRISGRATDAEGQPVPRISINAVPVKDLEKEYPNIRFAQADEEGNFKFEALPAGSYLIGVRLSKYPQQNDPTNALPRTYHPGVETAAQAEPVTVGAGEHVKDFVLRLPPRRAESVIKGVVVWADGKPVAKANVSYRETTYQETGVDYGMQADEQGRFTIKGYVGQTFLIKAGSTRAFVGDFQRDGPMERAEPIRVTLANPAHPVKIVVTRIR